MKIAYDEMHAADGSVRDSYRSYADWLQATPADVIARKREEADLAFHRVGITFAVYGEDAGQERLIPFDIIPRIIPAAEWKRIAAGLRQRVKALNAFLHDIYHDQEILKAGRIPAGAGAGQFAVPQGDGGRQGAGRHLRPHRRRRPGARRRGRVLRAGGQPAHALRRVLHARRPQDDDAALPRTLRPPGDRPGRALPRPAARQPALGGAGAASAIRTSWC
jgi:hypothetical protein